MNIHTNRNDSKNGFEDLFKPRAEEAEVKHDAIMLMAGFLSEIEAIQDKQKVSRKELAEKIDTSASYLTQVFRSKKPLNFVTLAKIKRVLNIRFEIKALEKNLPTQAAETQGHQYNMLNLAKFASESMSRTSDTVPATGSTFHFTPVRKPEKV